LEFDEEKDAIKFGGNWKLFWNARQLYEGKGIRLGSKNLGHNAVLYCTFAV